MGCGPSSQKSTPSGPHMPPSRGIKVPDAMRNEWERCGGTEIESVLRSGAVALLDARWVVALWENGGRISRRQELPDEAFLSVDEVIAAGADPFVGLHVVAMVALANGRRPSEIERHSGACSKFVRLGPCNLLILFFAVLFF